MSIFFVAQIRRNTKMLNINKFGRFPSREEAPPIWFCQRPGKTGNPFLARPFSVNLALSAHGTESFADKVPSPPYKMDDPLKQVFQNACAVHPRVFDSTCKDFTFSILPDGKAYFHIEVHLCAKMQQANSLKNTPSLTGKNI